MAIKKTAKTANKKTAAKKTTAKKATAAKKTAVKKTTAKTAPAKKATAKKPAAKKTTAVKKTTAKKTTVKKTTAKTAPAKTTAVKKPAAAKTAKPETAKPAAKPAVAKPASAKPAVKKTTAAKPVAAAKPAEVAEQVVKYRNLFDAYAQGKLPFAQGYIVSSFFSETSAYSIYEVVSYAGVKEIFASETGLQFITGGKKLYILVEPDTYHNKPVEPVSRAEDEKIPKRFNELETIIAKNQTRIMVAKEPNETFGSFTVLKPQGANFAVVFYETPELYESLITFFEDSLNRQRKVPQADAKKAAKFIAATVEKTMSFKGEFE
ncbi:MAG: histone H1-like repetitive region-containing protein [Treponema sp.]|jgi:hypothetical protein|nr:histone H1-like repetitive region-containing protein [Treponema sp.]